jgi:hypothetical protein
MACINKQKGSLETFVTPAGGETLNLQYDCSRMKEIECFGQIITNALFEVLQNNALASGFSVSNVTFDSTKTKINFTLTNLTAVPPSVYQLVATISFSGGGSKKANLDVEVGWPQGGQVVPCGCN